MKKGIIKLLNLQGILVDKLEFLDEPQQIFVVCRGARRTALCPVCGANSKRVHQTSVRLIKHGVINYREVILRLKVRRFKCRQCCKVFTEKFSGIDRRRASANLMIQAMDWLRRNSFNFTGEQFHLSPGTLTRYLMHMSEANTVDWATANVTKLGIDEHSFRGKHLVITITDLSNRKLLAVLKSDTQVALTSYLQQIPNEYRLKINEVCTDLRSSYGVVTKRLLPNADLTADRFHVELQARRALDELRTIIQDEAKCSHTNLKKLLWFNESQLDYHEKIKLELAFKKYSRYPILKQAWVIKEQIIQIYWAQSEAEARKQFEHVMMLLETCDNSHYLEVLHRTLKRWKQPILNYFKNKTTNGFTEGCHTKIKMIKRVSFGFRNIDHYIAKITLAFLPLIWILNYHTN